MYLLKYQENSNAACRSDVTTYASLKECTMQMQSEFLKLKKCLDIRDEDLLNLDDESDTGGRINEKEAFLHNNLDTFHWEIISEPNYMPAYDLYFVYGVYHDLKSGDAIHCTPIMCHGKADAQKQLHRMLQKVLTVYGLEENDACDKEGNAVPGGCAWNDGASIYNYAPYALNCLIEVASFAICSLKLQGTFVSVWDGGCQVSSPCLVDFQTGQVTVTEADDCQNEECLQILEREYVEISGQVYTAIEKEQYENMMRNEELTKEGIDKAGERVLWYT